MKTLLASLGLSLALLLPASAMADNDGRRHYRGHHHKQQHYRHDRHRDYRHHNHYRSHRHYGHRHHAHGHGYAPSRPYWYGPSHVGGSVTYYWY